MCKLINFLWSFKAMVLLFYSLWSDARGILKDVALEESTAKRQDDVPIEYQLDMEDYCHDPITGSRTDGVILPICYGLFDRHPLAYFIYGIVGLSSLYGVLVFLFAFCKSPKYGTLNYYAYMVMVKRARYFKTFVRIMYVCVLLIILAFSCGFWLIYTFNDGLVLPSLIRTAISTLILSGIAVSELRTTNEINFQYEMPDDGEPIHLKRKCCGCSLIKAEDMFERLEEAVSVYSITKNDKLLKGILLNESDQEVVRVMDYYHSIYRQDTATSGETDSNLTEMIKSTAEIVSKA